jgi:Na+-transporting methylmalonyl-CoA/oxaloacetate decarboxylase beta subunit
MELPGAAMILLSVAVGALAGDMLLNDDAESELVVDVTAIASGHAAGMLLSKFRPLSLPAEATTATPYCAICLIKLHS